ncbi:MAG: glycine betaine ABC transporter substrate-binding protein [Mycobacterium sp.]
MIDLAARTTVIRWLLVLIVAVALVGCGAPPPAPALTVGTSADPETTLLAEIYAAGLRYYGTVATVKISDDPVAALDDASVSVAPGFTGRLLERFAPDSAARSAAQVYRAMAGALPEGVATGDYAVAAEDKAALAVSAATATAWGSRDLTALVDRCSGVSIGAVAGTNRPSVVGACTLPTPREFRDSPAMFDALRTGAITAAWTGTAAADVPDGVVVLVDRKPTLVPAQNVVALYRRNELNQMQLRSINEIAGVLDTATLVDMLRQIRAGADPRSVAEAWLTANPLGR